MNVPLPDGGHLWACTVGTGPPLLLLRPLGGSVVSWQPFADTLSAHCQVVMFDPRGTGCSSAAPIGFRTRRMAADALALMEALAIPRAHVYGLSLGGMVASWLAIDAPTRVGRLVLASTPIRGLSLQLASLRRMSSLLRCLAGSARAAEACLATRILSPEFRTAHPDEVQRIRTRACARPASHRGLLTLLTAAALHDVRSQIGTVTAETLVIAGGRDDILGMPPQHELATCLPHPRLVTLPDAGHDVSAEAPEAVAGLVLQHLDGDS